jgi:hypothetical protein
LTVQEVSTGKNGTWFAAGTGVGEDQIFITKFDADNQVLWSHIYDDRRVVNFIHQLPGNGNTLIFNENRTANFDASILEIDENGNYVSETLRGTDDGLENWSDIISLPNKTHILLGQGLDGDTGAELNSLYIMDTLGIINVEQHFSLENGNFLRTLIPDATGGFYGIGGTYGNETAIVRYNELAELLWAKMYAWPSNDISLFDGTLLPDGSLFLYGGSNFTDTNIFSDFFGCKLSAEGEIINNFYLNTEDGVSPVLAHPMGGDTVLIATTSNNQYWPIVDNDNLSILINVTNGEVYNSYAFGSDLREFPYEIEIIGDKLVWAGLTNLYSTPDSSLGYIAFSPINGSGACEKNYAVSKGELVNLEPVVTEIGYFERPELPLSEQLSAQTDMAFTLTGSCSAVNAAFDPTNYCVVAAKNFDQTIEQVIEVADGTIQLSITDLSGRQLIQSTVNNNLTAAQLTDQLPIGWYVYSLSFKGCGGMQQVTGKLPVW